MAACRYLAVPPGMYILREQGAGLLACAHSGVLQVLGYQSQQQDTCQTWRRNGEISTHLVESPQMVYLIRWKACLQSQVPVSDAKSQRKSTKTCVTTHTHHML